MDAALELDPKYVKAWARKGDIEFLMKEFHKAMESYQKGLAIEEGNKLCKDGLQKVAARRGSPRRRRCLRASCRLRLTAADASLALFRARLAASAIPGDGVAHVGDPADGGREAGACGARDGRPRDPGHSSGALRDHLVIAEAQAQRSKTPEAALVAPGGALPPSILPHSGCYSVLASLQDPVVRQVITDLSTNDPLAQAAGQKALRDPIMGTKINKLIAAGVLQTG